MTNLLLILIVMCNAATLSCMESADQASMQNTIETGDQLSQSLIQRKQDVHNKLTELIYKNNSLCERKNADDTKPSLVLLPPRVVQQLMDYIFSPIKSAKVEENLKVFNDILFTAEVAFCIEDGSHNKYTHGFPPHLHEYIQKMQHAYRAHLSVQEQFSILHHRIETILKNNKFKDEKPTFITTKLQS